MTCKLYLGPFFHPRFDGWKNKYISSDQMTWRALRESLHGKGTVDVLMGLYDFRDYLFCKVVTYLDTVTWFPELVNSSNAWVGVGS